jgi:hypothetical protein
MRGTYLALTSAAALALAAIACSDALDPTDPFANHAYGSAGGAIYSADEPFETDLIAGRRTDVGRVTAWNDEEALYVRFEIEEPGWCLYETHVHAAESLGGIPHTRKGNPIPGHFADKAEHECSTDITRRIALTWEPGTELFVAAHAALSTDEGAWAAGTGFPGRNPAMYFTLVIGSGVDEEEDTGGGLAVRYRSFGNTQEPEVQLGVFDLEADERVELDLGATAWSGSNELTFSYDPASDLLATTIGIGSQVLTLEYPSAAAASEALTGCALAGMSRLVFTLSAGDAGTSVVLRDVLLDGAELGSLSGADGPNVFELGGLSFSSGFTITGDLLLSGVFGSEADLSFAEIAILCPEDRPTVIGDR